MSSVSMSVTPTTTDSTATIMVNGVSLLSGTASAAIPLTARTTTIAVVVTAQDGVTTTSYTIVVTRNTAPTYAGYSLTTPYQTAATISFAKLLTKAFDADGDPVSIIAAGASGNGGTVQMQAATLTYTPPGSFSGTDVFPITISDKYGATAAGSVTVTVNAANASSTGGGGLNTPTITSSGGNVGLTFQAIPGRTYVVQRSTDLANWQNLATLVADPTGAVQFTDNNPPPFSGFYRMCQP